METFSALLALCAGDSPVTGEFPLKRPVARSFDIFFDLGLKKGWVNNRDNGDLRLHRADFYVTVMLWRKFLQIFNISVSLIWNGHISHILLKLIETGWRIYDICVNELNSIGSDDVLSSGRRQAIVWTNAGILLIGPLGTKLSAI